MNFSFKSISCLTTLILMLAVLLPLPQAQAAVELDRIVAVVNDDVVMSSELSERVRTVKAQLEEQGSPLPPVTVLEKQVLDRLILQKLQIQTALNTGIRVDDETLNRTISNIAAENQLTLAQFREVLEQDKYSYNKFREDMRNEILMSRLQQRQVDNRVTVSEREIENFLANQEHMGESDLEYHLGHILIAIPDGADEEQLAEIRKKASQALEELKAGKDLAAIAATYSDGDQAKTGGDLGWRKASQIPSLFTEFVADMEKGDVSDLINSPSGYHIIKLMDVRATEKYIVTQTHSRHILLKTDELISDDDAVMRLQQLKLRIEGGDDFGEVAKGNSLDMSAADGGDMGWTNPGELVPEYEEVMNTLQADEISVPFKTQYGWHIVQVLDRREHDSSDDIRRARARDEIRKRKLAEARDSWLRQMREDAYVEYRIDF
ncbi:MAG: molecular chaperone SurA [Gammaproteobacteria bacterium RIFCSPLOWO2_02_FULL_52_10]|nr:MAG: molecular chaperone SurA [Gammaproteobacteria bacterium RIFCSPLOWO2_02_FULL_52_10]